MHIYRERETSAIALVCVFRPCLLIPINANTLEARLLVLRRPPVMIGSASAEELFLNVDVGPVGGIGVGVVAVAMPLAAPRTNAAAPLASSAPVPPSVMPTVPRTPVAVTMVFHH